MPQTYYIDHVAIGSINLGNRTRHEVTGTYQDAVDAAHRIYQSLEKKTGVSVHSDHYCLYFWHYITADGKVTDRNTNSGVKYPESYAIKYENGYVAA